LETDEQTQPETPVLGSENATSRENLIFRTYVPFFLMGDEEFAAYVLHEHTTCRHEFSSTLALPRLPLFE
jgi:hypothetical protein